jgi:hypothetical protein
MRAKLAVAKSVSCPLAQRPDPTPSVRPCAVTLRPRRTQIDADVEYWVATARLQTASSGANKLFVADLIKRIRGGGAGRPWLVRLAPGAARVRVGGGLGGL